MEPSRIALLIETDGAGGAERMVAQLARELGARGHAVRVYVPPRSEGWLERQLDGSGVQIDHFWLTRPFDPGCARELAASFLNDGIEIAHSHEFSMAFYGSWAAQIARIPHVITMHGRVYWADALRRRIALRYAMRRSGATISVSQALARQMSKDLLLPRRRIGFIPNGGRLQRATHSSLRGELGLSEEDQLLLSVGSLYPVKGHRHLLEAAAQLTARHPRLHVAIAGQGQLHDSLLDAAVGLGISDRVHLLGLRADISNLLAGADLFVLPSLEEGLPLAVLEAMLAGRPIIASDVGDVGPVLGHGQAGVIVKPGDPEDLANAIDRLLNNPVEAAQLGLQAARRAEREYRLERMTGRYEALYESLLRGAGVTGLPVPALVPSAG